jgi:hypothetical protein
LAIDFGFSDGVNMAKGGRRQGAGRPGWRRKVEECTRLDVRHFYAAGPMINSGSVTIGHKGRQITHSVAFTSTACGFGGRRVWFVCPVCNARSGNLFAISCQLACRKCHGLAYRSQSLGGVATAFACMFRCMNKLGPDFTRPKGMHHSTYLRLMKAAHAVMIPASLMVDNHMKEVRRQLDELGLAEDEFEGLAKVPSIS